MNVGSFVTAIARNQTLLRQLKIGPTPIRSVPLKLGRVSSTLPTPRLANTVSGLPERIGVTVLIVHSVQMVFPSTSLNVNGLNVNPFLSISSFQPVHRTVGQSFNYGPV